jgi:hypothetical protein
MPVRSTAYLYEHVLRTRDLFDGAVEGQGHCWKRMDPRRNWQQVCWIWPCPGSLIAQGSLYPRTSSVILHVRASKVPVLVSVAPSAKLEAISDTRDSEPNLVFFPFAKIYYYSLPTMQTQHCEIILPVFSARA